MSVLSNEMQRKAARIVGIAYLFAMVVGMFTEGYVRPALIDYQNAAVTAKNIIQSEFLFRLSTVLEILTFVSDSVLIASLYVILAPINRHLALIAAVLRLVAVGLCVVMTTGNLEVLRLLSGAEYLQPFGTDQLNALARLSIGGHGSTYIIAFIFLGLGSTVFAYLWLKSDYIPRTLAVLGLVGSALLAAGSLSYVLSYKFWLSVDPFHMIPLFFFEVGMGFWLIIKGLR